MTTEQATRLDPAHRDEEVGRLFEVVFEPGDLVEFRPILRSDVPSKGRAWQVWTGEASSLTERLDDLESLIESGWKLYFGANPRRCKGGTAEDVKLARCLFIDIDGGCTVDEARRRVADALLPTPSAIVESGGGVHCYWRLEEPIEDREQWESIQEAVNASTGADRSVKDYPRVMRLPAMWNVRRGRLARLVDADPRRVYGLDEFEHVVEEAKRRRREAAEAVQRIEIKPGRTMSEQTRSFIESGQLLPGGGRRQTFFTAACDLAAHGWSIEEARAKLMPRGDRLGLDADEVQDLDRQLQNAFRQPRTPYMHDRMRLTPQEAPQEEPDLPKLPSIDDHLNAFMAYRDLNRGRTLVGMRTGFSRFDELMSGLSGMSILAAAPGCGKTTMTLQLGLQTLALNPQAAFVFMSAEMQPRELTGRLLSMRSGLSYRRLALPGLSGPGRVDEEAAKVDEMLIDEASAALRDVARRMRIIPPELIIDAANRGDLSSWMQRMTLQVMDEVDAKEVVCVLDNLQQCPMRSSRHDGEFATDLERDRYAIESMMRVQHGLADHADRAATIVVSEISKQAMRERDLDLSAIIGSIRSVYKSDNVGVLAEARRVDGRGKSSKIKKLFAKGEREQADFGRRCIDLMITKGRAPAELGRLLFAFDYRKHKMAEIDEDDTVRVGQEDEE